MKKCLILLALSMAGCASLFNSSAIKPEKEGMPLLFSDDFSAGMEHWETTDAQAWEIRDFYGDLRLHLKQHSDYEPPVLSPYNIAWIKDLNVSDFILEVECKQRGQKYKAQDLCFFFNKQDSTHFYYVHLTWYGGEHANSIFLVNNAPRLAIAKEYNEGISIRVERLIHEVRIKRDTKSGSIEVYVDNMRKPIISVVDRQFSSGAIGLGSFDDTGWFDNVRLWGKEMK